MSFARERIENFDSDNCVTVAKGCAGGCLTYVGVGVVLGLFGAAIGATCSAKIPATDSHISAVSAVGDKQQAEILIPAYIKNRDRNNTLIDAQSEISIGSLRFNTIESIGKQPNAPRFRLSLDIPEYQNQTGTFGFRQIGIIIPDSNIQEQK